MTRPRVDRDGFADCLYENDGLTQRLCGSYEFIDQLCGNYGSTGRLCGSSGRLCGRGGSTLPIRLCVRLLALISLWSAAGASSSPADEGLSLLDLQDVSDLDTGQLTSVSAMRGGVAELPCHVDPDNSHDVQRLVLWYWSGSGAPFYSYDTRGGRKGQGTHWASEDSLGRRSRFDPHGRAPVLRIKDVTLADAGMYRCRADFKTSPTLNARVRLTVVVPPGTPEVVDDSGRRVEGRAGPYHVGTSVTFVCRVRGGHPAPNVTWWLDGELLDDSWERDGDGLTSNTLRLERLQRHDLLRTYTCSVSNSQLQKPLTVALRLDVTYPPQRVEILNSKSLVLEAGRAVNLTCQVTGSRPPPVITWFKNGESLPGGTPWTSSNNVTSSTVELVTSAGDAGHVIRCRAYSPADPSSALEDQLALRVNHAPLVRVSVASSLRLADIQEGDDVYFECDVTASPPAHSVQWRLNGRPLVPDSLPAGVMVVNRSLVLQKVTSDGSGSYSCAASNAEGDGVSDSVSLLVRYVPRCSVRQQTVYSAALHQTVKVPCRVDALPDQLTFHWSFNNTGDIVHLPTHQFTVNGSGSTAIYTAHSALDYGTLLCWAQNDVGLQREPCLFHITPAAVPESPSSCTSHNGTDGSVAVLCRAPAADVLPRRYVLEVRGPAGELLLNLSAGTPRFLVPAHLSSSYHQIILFAENAKGRSKPLVIDTHPARDAVERRTERIIDGSLKANAPGAAADSEPPTVVPSLTLLLVAAGAGALLVTLPVLAVVLLRRRRRRRPAGRPAPPAPTSPGPAPATSAGRPGRPPPAAHQPYYEICQ
ncbi:hemicentin-2-like [Amphibalanus amphitrite]|uniref:hemicentin-2-like n=1 Tax=Amphibalanus amphitrite TaxID=1232801 RepID=UPI001C914991|nr:hemicentin-2-like [Amphibalanus amphitrite]